MPSRPQSALPRLRARLLNGGRSLARLRAWVVVSGIAAAMVLALTGVAAAGAFDPAASRTSTAGASGQPGAGTGRSGSTAAGHSGGSTSRSGSAAVGGTNRGGSNGPARASASALASAQTQAPARGQAGQAPGRAGSAASAGGTGALRTSCRNAAHIGDSVSADLISPASLPDPAQRLGARYADVGVRHLRIDASGGRSIVEALPGQVNGYDVAQGWWKEGYRGCWIFALGTNDTANIAAGSAVGMMARIERMMSVAHGEPVLWVNTRTELSTGPWSAANERLWDATLRRALARYPNMRIFDWSAVAQPGWFLPDGIHYNSVGCAVRAKAIADALAKAFPAGGHGAARHVAARVVR
jgi:hypothetical protein